MDKKVDKMLITCYHYNRIGGYNGNDGSNRRHSEARSQDKDFIRGREDYPSAYLPQPYCLLKAANGWVILFNSQNMQGENLLKCFSEKQLYKTRR